MMSQHDPELGFTNRHRQGLPVMRPRMLRVMVYLDECARAGFPWAHLPADWKLQRTLKAMIRRDWIMRSDGHDGTRYKLLRAGKLALEAYQPVIWRKDCDICPRCCERPKHRAKSGRAWGYCRECMNEYKNEWRHGQKAESK